MQISFNVNEVVLVKLTEVGKQKLREQDEQFARESGMKVSSSIPKEDSEGWSRWQLWELMNRLGNHCYMGCQPPFDLTIRFEVPEHETATI